MAQEPQPAIPLERFVRQTFFHSVPYEQAALYGPEVAPKLLEMLGQPAEEEHWSNIVVTLCIVADDDVFEHIRAFIGEDGTGVLPRASYAAKTNAITALGYLVYRTGSEEALKYLTRGLEPSTWSERIQWRSPYHSADELNSQLAQLSVIALALSGSNEARQTLEISREDVVGSKLLEGFQDLLDEAIETNKTVQLEGLEAYLRSRSP